MTKSIGIASGRGVAQFSGISYPSGWAFCEAAAFFAIMSSRSFSSSSIIKT
jgi:hypothetical protein